MVIYHVLADVVMLIHAAIVAFVVAGLVLTVLGLIRRWAWVRNFWFRAVHLAAIAVVVGQAWLGVICPLTHVENWLRREAGGSTYPGGMVAYWLNRALFYDAEPWIFTLCYTIFGALVLATFVFGPPRLPRARMAEI